MIIRYDKNSTLELSKDTFQGTTYIHIRRLKFIKEKQEYQASKNMIIFSTDISYLLIKYLKRFIRLNKIDNPIEIAVSDTKKLVIEPDLQFLTLRIFEFRNHHYQPKKYQKIVFSRYHSALLLNFLMKAEKDNNKLFGKKFSSKEVW